MQYIELIALLSVFQFFFFGFMTGQARRTSGLKAPAVTGHEGFERMYRVQMNSLEMIIIFLPALFISANYWSPLLISSIGMIYIVGRFIYWRAYVTDPATRSLGFMLTMIPTFLLIVLGLVGIALSIIGIQ